jgi:hypothetical protein
MATLVEAKCCLRGLPSLGLGTQARGLGRGMRKGMMPPLCRRSDSADMLLLMFFAVFCCLCVNLNPCEHR